MNTFDSLKYLKMGFPKRLLVFLLIIPGVNIFSQAPLHTDSETLQRVGMVNRGFEDNDRKNWLGNAPRPLRTVIWYPSSGGIAEEKIGNADLFKDSIVLFPGSSIADTTQHYPLILISHGAGGNAMQMGWLGYYFASRGYIVAAVNHSGTPEEERNFLMPSISDFCMWERPKDLKVVLNKLIEDSVFRRIIDTSRIAVAGFSLGGTTAIWMGGARLNLRKLVTNSPIPIAFRETVTKLLDLVQTDPRLRESKKHAQESYKDSRIKAIFALAPAIGQGFTHKGLTAVSVPVKIVVGDSDVITPPATNARLYASHIKNSNLVLLSGEVGHFTRNSTPEEHSRILNEVNQLAFDFFEETLNKK